MAFLQPANLKSQSKRHKKRLTDVQMRLLETSFIHDKKLDPERKIQLATDLGLPPRQVAVWYQNKRARWKTQALELDYKTLRVRHDNLATEKRLLEKEVERLKGELERAQEMLRLNDNLFSSFPSSSDEDGRPALGMDLNSYWESPGVLQVEEFYPGMMGQVGNSISMIHLPTQLPDVDKFRKWCLILDY